MKKTTLLLAAAWMLLLWFVPQSAKAELDVAGNLTKPFTIETTTTSSGGEIEFRKCDENSNGTNTTINLEYRISTDGGESWGDWIYVTKPNNEDYQLKTLNTHKKITLAANTTYKIQLRGDNPNGFSKSTSDYYRILIGSQSTSWCVTLSGNVMSLVAGYDTDNEPAAQAALVAADEIKSNYCFYHLLSYQIMSPSSKATITQLPPRIDATNLIFPATYLTSWCYAYLFYTPTQLTINSQNYNLKDFSLGVNEGPCFLAPNFNDKNGSEVRGALRNAFMQCESLNSAHFNFSVTPSITSDIYNDNLYYWVYTTKETKTIYAPTSFIEGTSYSDGNTHYVRKEANIQVDMDRYFYGDWSNTETWSYASGGGDEPGGGGGESITPAAVNVYQAGTTDTTKILYDLPANAVDLGVGVAWATSNYDGAEESKFAPDNTVAGPYYKPSEIILPQNWRIPTQEDGSKLIGNSFTKNGSVVTIKSLIDNQTVTLVGSGYGQLNSYNTNRYTRPGSGNYGDSYPEYPYYYLGNSGNTYYLLNINTEVTPNTLGVLALVNIYNATYYFTTRLVYDPSFTTHTLTIHCGDKTYTYMCEDGQSVTVTAHADDLYVFKWWSDDNSNTTATRTFTVNEDMNVEAVFTADPSLPSHQVTFYDYDGTVLYQDNVAEGFMPVYEGETPTRSGYLFTGWDRAITAMGKSETSYTAQYIQLFNITATATSGTVTITPANASDEVSPGVFKSGASVTLSVTVGSGSSFSQWNDGNTDNPRTITVTADADYVATIALESPSANVNVYQNISANTTKIVYNIDPKTGKDGKTYIPIDMGYGVAWADRNVGASTEEGLGGWYRWGNTTPETNQNSTTTAGNTANAKTLTDAQDAAYQKMGSNWHMPTKAEFEALYNNSTISDNKKFTSKVDADNYIILPAYGYFINYGNYNSSSSKSFQYYWTKEKPRGNGAGSNSQKNYVYAFIRSANNTYSVKATDNDGYANNSECHMQIRAIYVPSYTPCTLTVNIQGSSYSYKYLCQPGQEVTVTANATEGSVFDKWNDDNTNATRTFTVTGNVAYTATFKEAPTGKTIIWQDEDGTELERDENVTLGTMPSYDSETPAKDATAQYTYSFSGWSPTVVAVTDDATYTATYNSTLRSYTITFENEDGTELQSGSVSYGETPSYDGETPTKDEDAENTYTFDAWSPAIAEVTGNTTYTATFTATPKPAELHIVLKEAEDDDYYDDFATRYGGKTANTVTLNRQFTQGRWSTLCLPFEVSGGMMTTLKMSGRVYEFKYATGNANVGEGVNLYFSNAKKMEAGKGYIVNANATLAEKTSFVFSNVKIDVSKDLGEALNSKEAYDNLSNANGYKSQGDIELVGTLRNGTLIGSSTEGNTYMGLKENKIYYPNTDSGSTIWAYRGIFHSSKALDIKNMQKMRIIVDGEDRGELIIDEDGEILDASGNAESRKFIENGILYIEREGVIYDAQGKRVESSF